MVQSTDRTRKKSGRWRKTLRAGLLVVFCFLLAGFALRRPVLAGIGDFLNVGVENPAPADAIFVLGGDIHSRPSAAARLYAQGLAPTIVMSRVAETPATRIGAYPNETDAAIMLLERLGVPRSAIVMLTDSSGVTSTRDEAAQLHAWLTQHPADRVLIVTSDYHTRRTRWLMEREMPELGTEFEMYGAPDPRFSADNWWQSEQGMLSYVEEYAKFVHNRFYP